MTTSLLGIWHMAYGLPGASMSLCAHVNCVWWQPLCGAAHRSARLKSKGSAGGALCDVSQRPGGMARATGLERSWRYGPVLVRRGIRSAQLTPENAPRTPVAWQGSPPRRVGRLGGQVGGSTAARGAWCHLGRARVAFRWGSRQTNKNGGSEAKPPKHPGRGFRLGNKGTSFLRGIGLVLKN